MNSRSLPIRIRERQRTTTRRHRYPEALRQEIVAHVRARRVRGEGLGAVAKSLGMSPWTIREWLRDGGPEHRRGFRRVELEPTPAVRVVLVTPTGYRLEGDTESLAAILKALS